jgi:hypothetical protein
MPYLQWKDDDDNGDNEAAIVSVLRAGGFKHTRYKSFLRQLMLYNFERTYKGPKKGECKHAYFVRGRPELFQQKSVKDFQQYQATKMMLKNNAAASTPTSSISASAFVSPPNSPIRPTTRCLLLSLELVFSLPPCPSLLNHSNNDADDIGNIKESGCPYMKTSIIPTRLNNCNNDNSDKLLIPYKNMGDCSALFDEEQEYGSDIKDIIFIDGENSNKDIIPLTETEIDMLWEGI